MDLPSLLTALTVTVMAYCAFPLIFATARKKKISAKKYRVFCYLFNFLIMLFFAVVGGGSSGAPYLIWTSLFCAFGLKILGQKELVAVTDSQETEGESNSGSSAVSVLSSSKQAKDRFCKYCGCPIDSATKKCTGCGKQFFKLPTVKRSVLGKVCVVLLCVALLGFMIWCGYLNEVNKQMSLQLADQSSSIQSLEKTLEENSKTIETLNQKLSAAKKSLKQLQIDYDDLESKADDIREKVRFYDRYVVFVLEEKPGLYHKYGCPYMKYLSYSFYVYDIDVAKQLGYTQCTMCD